MDYIINPAWFYWIEVADTIKAISIITIVVLLIACVVLAIIAGMDRSLGDHTEAKVLFSACAKCLIFLAVSALICIFIPSKKTLMEMQIARLATRSNVELTIAQVKEIVDYIINAIKELK